jgi:tripartite-type tricarboxylate transporter receptor subunit TctC
MGMRVPLLLALLSVIAYPLPGAAADSYPSRPIKLIVPWPAGGITDVLARPLAQRLGRVLGQNVIVDNRPGASGVLGMATGAKAPADGYTVILGSSSTLAVAPSLNQPIPYDLWKTFTPVTLHGYSPMVLVANASLKVHSVKELVELGRARRRQLIYASNGPAGTTHITGEAFLRAVGIEAMHIPYKGSTPALMAMLGNEAQFGFDFPATCAPHVKAGKLTALLVTGAKRVPLLPDVSSAVEAGLKELDLHAWLGYFVPAGTPTEIIAKLNKEITSIVRSPEMLAEYERMAFVPIAGSTDEFRAWILNEQTKWGRVIAQTGVKAE